MEIVAVLRHHFGRIHNIGFRFQQADDALRRRLCGLQFREDAGNIAHGLEEADGVVDEHGQRADGHSDAENVRTADDAVAALPERIRRRQRPQRHDDGQEEVRQRRRADGRGTHGGGNRLEFLDVQFFAHKGFRRLCAVDALIEARGNLAVVLAHLTIRRENRLLELPADDGQRRQHQHDNQPQPPVDGQHPHGAGNQIHRAPAQVHQRPADGVRKALRVVGQAGHEVTHGHPVVVGEGQFLQFLETELANQVARSGFDNAALPQKAENRRHLHRRQQRIRHDKPNQPSRAVVGNEHVNRVGIHVRHNHVDDCRNRHEKHNRNQVLVVRLCNLDELAPQGEIKSFGIILFLKGLHISSPLPPPWPASVLPPRRSGCC